MKANPQLLTTMITDQRIMECLGVVLNLVCDLSSSNLTPRPYSHHYLRSKRRAHRRQRPNKSQPIATTDTLMTTAHMGTPTTVDMDTHTLMRRSLLHLPRKAHV